jgi:hypothetical protein
MANEIKKAPEVPFNFHIGGEGGIRTLDGLLTRPKTLRNQQVTDFYADRVPLLPLDSPPLAVGLAIDAQPSLHSLLQV